ncbi:MAG: hypothetical protein ABR922_16745 [Streptosporangiaceae bacterium]|jgi:hypothetical protein
MANAAGLGQRDQDGRELGQQPRSPKFRSIRKVSSAGGISSDVSSSRTQPA